MTIVYAALDQRVPDTLGGSVHVQAVAQGLAALGHTVHVLAGQGGPWPAPQGHTSVQWHDLTPPFRQAALRWTRVGAVETLARQVGADVIMERYYNFGGEGVRAATRLGIPAVLEVNAPMARRVMPRHRSVHHAQSRHPADVGGAGTGPGSRVGRQRRSLPSGRHRAAPVHT